MGNSGKALFAAHSIDHALLPARKHVVRKNMKMAEHPHKIHTLEEGRRDYMPRPDGRLHLHDASRQFVDQHTWAHPELEITDSNSRATIIAPPTMQWEAFFHRYWLALSRTWTIRFRSGNFCAWERG
jgi:hypothetical protein